jgi:hypothetical protein
LKSTDVSEKHFASISRVEEDTKPKISMKRAASKQATRHYIQEDRTLHLMTVLFVGSIHCVHIILLEIYYVY